MKRFRLKFWTVRDLLAREGEPPAADPPAADPPAADPPAADPPAGLLSGKVNTPPASDPPAGEFTIPEKFLVRNAEGKEDWEAIVKKTLPAYSHLEKRLGAGEAPPESPDKYKIENYLPEGYERNAEAEGKILGKLHELKLSNAQAQGVLSFYGEILGGAVASEKQSMDSAMAALKGEWKDSFDKNMDRANFALSSLADEATAQEITSDPKLMNNPSLIRLLAKMGEELEDDSSANELGAGEIEDIDQLRRSEAYLDEKHADHKRVVAKVNAAYARGYKDKH